MQSPAEARNEVPVSKPKKPSLRVERTGKTSSWHIVVTWPDGRRELVEDFDSKDDAQTWIERKATDWLAIQMGDGRTIGS